MAIRRKSEEEGLSETAKQLAAGGALWLGRREMLNLDHMTICLSMRRND